MCGIYNYIMKHMCKVLCTSHKKYAKIEPYHIHPILIGRLTNGIDVDTVDARAVQSVHDTVFIDGPENEMIGTFLCDFISALILAAKHAPGSLYHEIVFSIKLHLFSSWYCH